jgi:hypothetical protein
MVRGKKLVNVFQVLSGDFQAAAHAFDSCFQDIPAFKEEMESCPP